MVLELRVYKLEEGPGDKKKLRFDQIQRTTMDFCSLWVFTAMSDYKTLW